jgi:hypothetical protein
MRLAKAVRTHHRQSHHWRPGLRALMASLSMQLAMSGRREGLPFVNSARNLNRYRAGV